MKITDQTSTETGTQTTNTAPENTQSRQSPVDAPLLSQGGCHCGAVRFQVALAPCQPGSRCNCSVCTKTAVTSAIVKPPAFTLLTGQDDLASYAWGARISRRFFCRHCGVHCFGRGFLEEVGGDYVSVNLNCLDGLDPATLPLIYWDGRHDNWHAGPRATPWPVAAPAPVVAAAPPM